MAKWTCKYLRYVLYLFLVSKIYLDEMSFWWVDELVALNAVKCTMQL